jgi:hypothetical protein
MHANKIGLIFSLVRPEEQPLRFEKDHGFHRTLSPLKL